MNPSRSERVASLAAECIRALVWKRFHTKMEHSHFMQLGRDAATLSAALTSIQQDLGIYENVSDRRKATELAVLEASLHFPGKRLSQEALERLIEVRGTVFGAMNERLSLAQLREQTLRRIAKTKRDVAAWTVAYTHFMDELASLHSTRVRELYRLGLSQERLQTALAELEEIIKQAAVAAGSC